MMRYLFILLLLCGCNYDELKCSSDNPSCVQELKNSCSESFDLAEKQVFKPITPKPNDGTNPDPAKCICNGTGIIVQGDGHKTVCPYHNKSLK